MPSFNFSVARFGRDRKSVWPQVTYFQKWEVNTVIRKHALPKKKIADIYSAWCLYANSCTFSTQRFLFLQHLTPYFIAFLVQLGWISVHSQIVLIIYIYTHFTQMQDINWCSLSYPWPFPVHAGKRRTEVETSPGKHSLYDHHQCPIQVSSGGKWYPLASHCSWLQSLPKDKILHFESYAVVEES